jgi:ribonuclease G
MDREILINVGIGETRIAIVADGRLEKYFLERTLGFDDEQSCAKSGPRGQSHVGDIVAGRVLRVLPGMQAAFVDIGHERAGFLAAREARCLADSCPENEEVTPPIGQCVREGEAILVQVVKDPIGEKGARLSAGVTLCGRLLVMTLGQPRIALSRRIEDEDERARLMLIGECLRSDIIPDAGLIFRTAAIGAGYEELRDDAAQLSEIWRELTAARRQARIPATLHRDLDLIQRTMRDEVDANTARILIDDRHAENAARAYCRHAMPEAERKIEFSAGPEPLFGHDIEQEIEQLYEPRVPLSSGGWITIEGTEALTAIDVNSGSFTAASALEETGLNVNLEAADEAGRQIRLRGIGGLIVLDFIHLNDRQNIQRVLDALTASLAKDRTPTQISGMSEFATVQITRKRLREPLAKLASEHCRTCHGTGRRPSRESVALQALRRVQSEGIAAPGKQIVVRASPEVADWLNHFAEDIDCRLSKRGVARVRFESCNAYAREGFDVSVES